MSKSKISWYNARAIANAVAEKAFEHVLTPAREHMHQVALTVYFTELAACGVTKEIHAKLAACIPRANNDSWPCKLYWHMPEDRDQAYTLHTDDKIPLAFNAWNLALDSSKDVLYQAHKDAEPIAQRAAAMAEEVCNQLKDRSVHIVVKTWPEIAPFVYAELRIDPLKSNAPAPVPFQDLINRHLLALPAPVAKAPVKRVKK